MRRPYSKIWLEDGPNAVIDEHFARAKVQFCRTAFLNVGYFGFEDDRLIGYSGFRHVRPDELRGRDYIVTLWDYSPGIRFIDRIWDRGPREFMTSEERALIKVRGADEFATIDKALRTPFDGVL